MRRLFRFVAILGGVVFSLVVLVAAAAVWTLRASLPELEGARPISGLQAPVRIARDALGVPDIEATNRVDASRALGFLHAQERFFQMDLLRRRGAGELAALVGPALLDHDREVQRHQLRASARETVRHLSPEHRAILDAYVEGVNQGLQTLGARPPEYLLLRTRPEPWRAEDSLLVGFAMYFTLQDPDAHHEQIPTDSRPPLPPEAVRFFRPDGSAWDAPLDGTRVPFAPMPGPEILDFSREAPPESQADVPTAPDPELVPGSNSWGVEGSSSVTGAAIVANDMHLDLGLPNIWYRVCLRWRDSDGTSRRLVGATLPGVPSLIIGSNGRIAWGFTNATLDAADLVRLEWDPSDPSRYRTPDGWKALEKVTVTLDVRGEASVPYTFERTIWGPVLRFETSPHTYAAHWIGHARNAIDFGLLDLESVSSVAEALTVAPRCHIPMQNFLVGDAAGGLGWTLIGAVPYRVGWDGRTSRSWADGQCYWTNPPSTDLRPRFVAQPGQRLWTANNRILGTADYWALGAYQTDSGPRAHQIRDDLLALPPKTDEPGLLSIHRDDRALFLEPWRRLLLEVLGDPPSGTPSIRWTEARGFVEAWGGRASVESVGYRLVRAFRLRTLDRIYEPVLRRGKSELHAFDFQGGRAEAPFWALVESKPGHLLNPRFPSYQALFRDAFAAVLEDLDRQQLPLSQATWGARNRSRIQHPLSRAVPKLGRFLDLTPTPLPGDDHMPRVQGVSFGASERMVVSPGHEERGLFHMPGGQSGHFLSPYYVAGHESWVRIEPTPLLPGPPRYTLTLLPTPRG